MSSPYPVVERVQRESDNQTPPRTLKQIAIPRVPSRPVSPAIGRRPASPLPLTIEPPSRAPSPLPSSAKQSKPTRRKPLKPHETAQASIDSFWSKFTAAKPSKPFTVLPNNPHASLLAASSNKAYQRHDLHASKSALASYAEARAACEAKVAKIVTECRRLNVKYRDPHFDIEDDFRKWMGGQKPHADCLMGLDEREETIGVLRPMAVKRVEDVFDTPQFFIDGASASDVRQGKEGDCWFMSALCTLSNKEELIQKVCVARDEQVGVYGFVFHRGT
jgi:Calpain family cysteine protease